MGPEQLSVQAFFLFFVALGRLVLYFDFDVAFLGLLDFF